MIHIFIIILFYIIIDTVHNVGRQHKIKILRDDKDICEILYYNVDH